MHAHSDNQFTSRLLQISPAPSTICRHFLFIQHGLAMIAGIGNGLPFTVKSMLVIAVSVSFYFSLKRYVFTSPGYTLKYSVAYAWQLSGGNEGFSPVTLLDSTVSSAWVILLHIHRQNEKKLYLPVFKDAVSTEEYRRLRVALKISKIN